MKIFRIHVKPNSKQQSIQQEEDGSFTIRLKSPPVDGKANEELIRLLATTFDVPKSSIRIKSGAGGRKKLVEIETDA
jgi:uncharacterized protein (TIGR00251 family)